MQLYDFTCDGGKRHASTCMPAETPLNPQPTLRGYYKWVVERLVEKKGERLGKVSAWIIERWIDENKKFLAEAFDITHEQYQRSGKVVQHPSSKR